MWPGRSQRCHQLLRDVSPCWAQQCGHPTGWIKGHRRRQHLGQWLQGQQRCALQGLQQ